MIITAVLISISKTPDCSFDVTQKRQQLNASGL